MIQELLASAVFLTVQHNNLCSALKPAMIALLFFAAKSILIGTNGVRAFSKRSVHLWRNKTFVWNTEAAFVWPTLMEHIITWSGILYIQSLQMVHGPLLMSLQQYRKIANLDPTFKELIGSLQDLRTVLPSLIWYIPAGSCVSCLSTTRYMVGTHSTYRSMTYLFIDLADVHPRNYIPKNRRGEVLKKFF